MSDAEIRDLANKYVVVPDTATLITHAGKRYILCELRERVFCRIEAELRDDGRETVVVDYVREPHADDNMRPAYLYSNALAAKKTA